MVDQLELVWSAETDSNSMVIGLLLAAKHAASLYGSAVRVLLFLRADIYDSLHFGEGDKFRGDELRITWTEQALRDLALARARASAGADLTSETLWGELFPAAVEGEETATYLFRRCLPRPRDAIQFLNLCQETASLIHGRDRITEADVVQAGRQFSDWKLKDLALEYLVAHPFLKHLFPLFQNTGYVVTRAVLATRFQAAAESLHRLFPAYADALTVPGSSTSSTPSASSGCGAATTWCSPGRRPARAVPRDGVPRPPVLPRGARRHQRDRPAALRDRRRDRPGRPGRQPRGLQQRHVHVRAHPGPPPRPGPPPLLPLHPRPDQPRPDPGRGRPRRDHRADQPRPRRGQRPPVRRQFGLRPGGPRPPHRPLLRHPRRPTPRRRAGRLDGGGGCRTAGAGGGAAVAAAGGWVVREFGQFGGALKAPYS